jgi:putative endonuclease
MLESKTIDKIYTGITTEPQKRLKTHNSGKGARFTRAGRPWKIAFLVKCKTKSEALKLEYKIKKLTRAKKLELINSGFIHQVNLT